MLYQKPLLNKSLRNIFSVILFILCNLPIHAVNAQEIDILLKGGHVIDPKNKIGSTPIERKMFVSTGSPLVVAGISGPPKSSPSSTGAAKTDLRGKRVPAKGRIVKPLITFLRFIKQKL